MGGKVLRLRRLDPGMGESGSMKLVAHCAFGCSPSRCLRSLAAQARDSGSATAVPRCGSAFNFRVRSGLGSARRFRFGRLARIGIRSSKSAHCFSRAGGRSNLALPLVLFLGGAGPLDFEHLGQFGIAFLGGLELLIKLYDL